MVHADAYISYLRDAALFAGLNGAALREVAESARLRQLRPSAYFFHQGEPATHIYLLTQGRVKFTQLTPEGRGILLRAIGPGEIFGAVSALGDADYPATARVSYTASAALAWSSETIALLMERHPHIALNAIRFLAGRLQEFQDRYRELATERVERRVAHALLRLSRTIGRTTAEGTLLDLALSRQDVAEIAGTTLFTASRILSNWQSQSIVQSTRERILIVDMEALLHIAEDLLPPQQTRP